LSGSGHFYLNGGIVVVERVEGEEKVQANVIDEKKLVAIMKRFLGTKAGDPDITKYYRIENGINFMATTLGSAVQIYFNNKHEGTFTAGTGKTFFRKPLPKEQHEDVQLIPEMVMIPDGKKQVKKPTGRYLEYPDVSGMFNKFNMCEFQKIEIPVADVDQFIAIHEAMEKAAKVGGMYNTAQMDLTRNNMTISLYDSPLEFKWKYWLLETIDSYFTFEWYHYDFSLMTSIFKSLKDMKVDKIGMYIKDIDHPILFIGDSLEYNYNFAIARKLVGSERPDRSNDEKVI
jgi:hypothetical protein